MTVEQNFGVDEANKKQFPVGMRVLAVDDDQVCLKLLEGHLRRCQYHVTATTQAATALTMLRENKNRFDLVISDVVMPDMDGFKLLELVGLEMDLPVIMISGNSDPNLVMKGVMHGACDYLIKPIRYEAVKTIWQHVIRKKKVDPKAQNGSKDPERSHQERIGGGEWPGETSNSDQNHKLNRKRKEKNEEEDGDSEENENENDDEDSSSQKKPRVVWSVELHHKFVAAVEHLGVDKAVPKRILDLMNVDKLTRENVASHLQKYRLYLKRVTCVKSQEANMVAAALGGRDPSYLRMNSLDGFGDFQNWSGQGTQLSNASLASFQPGGMLGRVNSRPPMGFRGFGSPGTIQMGTTHNYSNSVNNLAKFQQAILPGNQSGNLLQGMPTSLHLDQFQQNKCVPRIGEFSNAVDPNFFAVSNGFSSTGVNIGSSNNSFMLHGQQLQQQTQSRGGFGNQSSARLAIVKSELVKAGSVIGNDQSRLSDNWQNSVPITGYPSNSLALNDHCFSHPDLATSNLRNNFSPSTPHSASSPLNVPDNSVGSVTVQDSRLDNNPKFSGFGSINGTSNQNINYFPKQRWESHKLEFNSNQMFSSSSSPAPVHSVVDSLGQNVGQNNAVNGNITSTLQLNCATPNFLQHNGIEKPASDSPIKFNGEYPVEQTKSQRGVNSKSCDSFEDLFSSISKQNGDGNDIFPLGPCM